MAVTALGDDANVRVEMMTIELGWVGFVRCTAVNSNAIYDILRLRRHSMLCCLDHVSLLH
jgi:hypothetical protein